MTARTATLLLAVSLAGCASNPQPTFAPPPPAPTAAAPAQHTGLVLISISDPAADEGQFWDIALSPNGRFEGQSTWSDGATSFHGDCAGTRPASEAQRWFDRIVGAATLSSPGPRPNPDDLSVLDVSLGHQTESGETLYVPRSELDAKARAWAEGFIGECP